MINSFIKEYFFNFYHLPTRSLSGILLNLINSSLGTAYYFFAIYFVATLGMNTAQAAILVSCYGAGTILGGYIGGYLSDIKTPQLIAASGLLIQGVAYLTITQLISPIAIALNITIIGLSNYCFITANYTNVLSNCNNDQSIRLKALNGLNIASNLGIGIASLAIGTLAAKHLKGVFILCGIFLILLSITQFFKFSHASQLSDIESKSIKASKPDRTVKLPFSMKLILLCLFFTGMIVSQLDSTYSIYLKESFPTDGVRAFSIFFAFNTALIILFQNKLVNLFSECNKLYAIGMGSFLIGSGMFMLNFSYHIIFIILSSILFSMGEMIFFSMVQLYCYQQSKETHKGRALGTYRMIYATSKFLGPSIGGGIYFYFSSNTLWNICGLIGLFFLILFSYYKNLAFSINADTPSQEFSV